MQGTIFWRALKEKAGWDFVQLGQNQFPETLESTIFLAIWDDFFPSSSYQAAAGGSDIPRLLPPVIGVIKTALKRPVTTISTPPKGSCLEVHPTGEDERAAGVWSLVSSSGESRLAVGC